MCSHVWLCPCTVHTRLKIAFMYVDVWIQTICSYDYIRTCVLVFDWHLCNPTIMQNGLAWSVLNGMNTGYFIFCSYGQAFIQTSESRLSECRILQKFWNGKRYSYIDAIISLFNLMDANPSIPWHYTHQAAISKAKQVQTHAHAQHLWCCMVIATCGSGPLCFMACYSSSLDI